VVDSREGISHALEKRVRMAGAEMLTGARISETSGFGGLRSVRIAGAGGQDLGRHHCDLLAVS
jgi:hypothetical protein